MFSRLIRSNQTGKTLLQILLQMLLDSVPPNAAELGHAGYYKVTPRQPSDVHFKTNKSSMKGKFSV